MKGAGKHETRTLKQALSPARLGADRHPSIAGVTSCVAGIAIVLWGNVQFCNSRQGCDDFARFAARQLVFNWSSWVQSKYESADVEAWLNKKCRKASTLYFQRLPSCRDMGMGTRGI